MRLLVRQFLKEGLSLPLNYHHIQQAVIYRGLNNFCDYGEHLHNTGYSFGNRQFRMFTFSPLRGKYEIREKNIIFRNEIIFEVSSPDTFMIRMLEENISKNGLIWGKRHYSEIELYLSDETIETEMLKVRMLSPICVYTTEEKTKKTQFYSPWEEEFASLVNENFIRKYLAYYGVPPVSGVNIEPVCVREKDKYVTRYQNFYISGWKGNYLLTGERKYLDFLYQTGIGSKNSQGFGMACSLAEL